MTDKAKLYVVKNGEGKFLKYNPKDGAELIWDSWSGIGQSFITNDEDCANVFADSHHGHVVALAEAPKPEVVSQKEANLIDELVENVSDEFLAANISNFITENWDDYGSHNRPLDELRLIRALINGYTVAKKYLLPMDGTLEENDDHDNYQLYAYCHEGRWLTDECETDPSYKHFTVTQKELETAPAWVKTITPVEVTDDEQ